MKDINFVKKVSLTYGELMDCFNVKTNRCGYLTKEEANKNGFSDSDYEKFVSRGEKLRKVINKNGFSKTSVFTIANGEDGNFYLLDGQGRRMALKLMKEKDNCDFSSWEFVCDLYVKPMTEEEMAQAIIDLNTAKTNWQNKDLRRSNVLSTNDESVKEAYFESKKLEDLYGITNYMANLLTFGEKASHAVNSAKEAFTTRDYSICKDIFTEMYVRLITSVSIKIDKDGNYVERPKKVKQSIRNVNFGIAFVGCLRKIVKQTGNISNPEMARKELSYFTDCVINACNGDDAYVMQFFKCERNNTAALSDKMRRHLKKNETIRKALYFSEA